MNNFFNKFLYTSKYSDDFCDYFKDCILLEDINPFKKDDKIKIIILNFFTGEFKYFN